MEIKEILNAWKGILAGRRPSLSIEVTRECPLRCPGCYAYEDNHLGGTQTLRDLTDRKGDELVNSVLALVEQEKPLHLSIVGGDPLVRYREMEKLLPILSERGVHVQLVTSAFRPMAASWGDLPRLNIVVSIDGLEPDHNIRRAPATYEKILKNIKGQHVSVHCTITGQMMKQSGYLEEFAKFWNDVPDVKRIWFSIFTPQIGAEAPEILTPQERTQAVREMMAIRTKYPKIDMPEFVIKEYLNPPKSPEDCIFARTTSTFSADFKTKITPCQFGGTPDCTQCGCIASMGLAGIGNYKLYGFIPVGLLFKASAAIGNKFGPTPEPQGLPDFPILQR